MKDWQIAEAAEENLKSAAELVRELGLKDDEWTPYGRVLAKVDVTKVLKRVGAAKRAKYIDVTAITPTALGEARVQTGRFGADMKVRLLNDGPFTVELAS